MAQEVMLALGCTQIPYHHKDLFIFLEEVVKAFRPNLFIHLGDEVDQMGMNFFDDDPDTEYSLVGEANANIKYMNMLRDIFGDKCIVLHSNHGSLLYRRAKKSGIPRQYLKEYNDLYKLPPGWTWRFEYIHELEDGRKIYFHHGKAKPILKTSMTKGMCVVQAHYHDQFYVVYRSDGKRHLWQAQTGCLCDKDSLAMAYGKNNVAETVLGCLIIVNGTPIPIPMKVDWNNRWIRSI